MTIPEKRRVKCICKECGKEFLVYPYLENKQKYCSSKCYDKVKSKRMKLLKSMEDKRLLLYCHQCKKPFIVLEGRSKGRKYCSLECYFESKRKIDENTILLQKQNKFRDIWKLNI